MKPPPFDYHDPTTVDDVLALLAEHTDGASVLAGGQSLLPLLNMRLARPDVLIDVNRVDGLDSVEVTDAVVALGATVRLSTVERHPEIARALPVLADAVRRVAHPQIRSRTTVGGTLCHADPTAEVPTVAVALDADITLRSRGGSRVVAADDFFETIFTTVKEPDELLVRVEFPRRAGLVAGYDEISRRNGDFPFAGLCLGVGLADGVVAEARSPRPPTPPPRPRPPRSTHRPISTAARPSGGACCARWSAGCAPSSTPVPRSPDDADRPQRPDPHHHHDGQRRAGDRRGPRAHPAQRLPAAHLRAHRHPCRV